MSDEALASLKLNPQDQLAWTALYRIMRPWVYGNSFRWLSNFADAEDATQKTFMHLAMNWQRLEFDDWPELREYLKRTSSSRCIDLLRGQRRFRPGECAVEFREL
jgi:DNA-directed RNA polymerase specialized sigma24 family protein